MKMRSLVRLFAHSVFHWWSTQCTARRLLSDELMSSCVVGTVGCLDLRRCASALNGRVSTEWSRCPGAMARCTRHNVVWRSSIDWIPARIGRLSADVGRRHPVTIRKASFMAGPNNLSYLGSVVTRELGLPKSVEAFPIRWLLSSSRLLEKLTTDPN